MKEQDYKKLLEDLEIAKLEALTQTSDYDGGTCNFDTPLIKLENTTEKKLKDWYEEEYGVMHYQEDWYEIGYKILQGQGHKRTMMARKFSNALTELGYKSFVHYVID